MLYNSLSFIVFFFAIFVIYWLCPHKFRWIMLLLSNSYFYMSWSIKWGLLLFAVTAVSYLMALLIENPIRRKIFLIIFLSGVLGLLFFVKYADFFCGSIEKLFNLLTVSINCPRFNIIFPIGISFYSFQAISYVVDIYKKKAKAECHFGRFAVYLSFLATITSGPIERADSFLPQLQEKRIFQYEQAAYGLKLTVWGLFQKMMADILAAYVDKVFDSPGNYQGFALAIAVVFFTFQIYCDFSGYSNMSIGLAKLLGFDLIINFKSPYFSSSIKEFWRRWHISLSGWFRDYLYIPLGGNRVGKIRQKINLFITFIISGLWHGANWTYVFWGGLHGIAQVIEKIAGAHCKNRNARWKRVPACIFVFAFCSFAWIFFRAGSLSEAFYIIRHLFDGISMPGSYLLNGFRSIGLGKRLFFVYAFLLCIIGIFDWGNFKGDTIHKIARLPIVARWIIYVVFAEILILGYCTLAVDTGNFLYFQF